MLARGIPNSPGARMMLRTLEENTIAPIVESLGKDRVER